MLMVAFRVICPKNEVELLVLVHVFHVAVKSILGVASALPALIVASVVFAPAVTVAPAPQVHEYAGVDGKVPIATDAFVSAPEVSGAAEVTGGFSTICPGFRTWTVTECAIYLSVPVATCALTTAVPAAIPVTTPLLTLIIFLPLVTSHSIVGVTPAVAIVAVALIVKLLPTPTISLPKLAVGVELALALAVDVSVLAVDVPGTV